MKIAIVLYKGFTALDAVGPYEVLSRLPGAEVHFVASETGAILADTRMLSLVAEDALADIARPDILLVPGGLRGTLYAMKDPLLIDWVRAAHETSTYTLSVCTGSLILGAAGILRGKDATTHWLAKDHLERFGASYCNARIVEQGKIVTAAGVSAGIDMALFLTEKITSLETAQSIQLAIEYDPQPPQDMGSPEKATATVLRATEKVLAASFAGD